MLHDSLKPTGHPVFAARKGYGMAEGGFMDVWIMEQNQTLIKFKKSCPDMPFFFKVRPKIVEFDFWNGIGCGLKVPEFWLFGHLDKNQVQQALRVRRFCLDFLRCFPLVE